MRSRPVSFVPDARVVDGPAADNDRNRAGESGFGLGGLTAGVVLFQRLFPDALLQEEDPFEQRLRSRGAPRHVYVNGDDLVDALGDGVRIPERATAIRARAEADHVLRLWDLFVDPLQGRRHLV